VTLPSTDIEDIDRCAYYQGFVS
jgi:DNA excision repair protein ERCC-2